MSILVTVVTGTASGVLGGILGFLWRDRWTLPRLKATYKGHLRPGVFNVSVRNRGRETTLDEYWLEGRDGKRPPEGIISLYPFEGEWHQVALEGDEAAAVRHAALPGEKSVVIAFLAKGDLQQLLDACGGQVHLKLKPSRGKTAEVDITQAIS